VWNAYHKSVVVAETAYDWRTGEDFKGKLVPFPQTPEGQRDFLEALGRVVREAPGSKVRGIFWCPSRAEVMHSPHNLVSVWDATREDRCELDQNDRHTAHVGASHLYVIAQGKF